MLLWRVLFKERENKLKQEGHAMVYDGDGQSWCKLSHATKIITLWKREYEIRILTCIYSSAYKNGEHRAYSIKGEALVQTGSAFDHAPR